MSDEPKDEKEEKQEVKKEASSKFNKLIEEIEKMSLADAAELVKFLEDRWGVTAMAAAPVGAAAAPASVQAADKEEKSSYTVVLTDAGAQKIAAIKAVRELRSDLTLVDAKGLVEAAPKEVLKDVKKDEAEAAKAKLEAAGAKVELK